MNCYRSYVLCMTDGNWKSYSCPLGTRFSALDNRCVADSQNEIECGATTDGSEMIELFSDKIIAEFNCPIAGVFLNEFSVTCEDYILCVNTMQAELLAIYLHCGEGQFFSHEHSACIDKGSNYCDKNGKLHLVNHPPTRPIIMVSPAPSPLEQTTTASPTTASATTTQPPNNVDPTTPLITTRVQTMDYSETTTMSPVTSTSIAEDSQNEEDKDDLDFSSEVEILPSELNYPDAIPDAVFTCESTGRFQCPIAMNSNPMLYILCISVNFSTNVKGYLFQCPQGTLFVPQLSRCAYIELLTTTSTTEIITEAPTVTEIVTEAVTISTIPTEAITLDKIQELPTTTIIPVTTTASPLPSTWTTTETVTEIATTEVITTTVSQELTTCSSTPVRQCTAPGRFHNEYTLNCLSYLLCIENSQGEFIGTYFKCPKDTKFSAILQRCVRDYDCPYYHCTSPGVFPYVRDKDRYVLCVSNGSRLIAYRMKCPEETVFSNILRRCLPKKFKHLMAW